MADSERRGRRGNSDTSRGLVASYERTASSAVAASIQKAHEAIALIRSWD